MYIKSIVLDGFKSYGQRTEISGFDPMFNAITGLNGTGKSNILDSICFVLGISNLTHVRANSLQDLIYKNGQAGINKATVSITFDNRNPAQCPPGLENSDEITISRQIALGGKNKYMINGINVTGKKIQDLFCSVQLNVNNPHFLIMQGKITKVLNMKPLEILAMVEEAAGTSMYEVKRQATQRIIEKKDAKLLEFQAIIQEELSPKIQQLKAERDQYLEYQRTERELEHYMHLFQIWQYFESKRSLIEAEKALENGEQKTREIEEKITKNIEVIEQLEIESQNMMTSAAAETSNELQELESLLKETEKKEAKINARVKSAKENRTLEDKKKKQLERNVNNDQKALAAKEDELNKVQSLFEILKENDRRDTEAIALAEKKYEALCAGMEVNDQGETQTLAEQLMSAKEEASRASTESKQAAMQLTFCQKQLKTKENETACNAGDYESIKTSFQRTEREVAELENSMRRLNFSEERMSEMQNRRRVLNQETRKLSEEVERFEARKPYTSFKYRDPEPNFNRSSIKGVVCKLFSLKDNAYAAALETAAGEKLYNVVVDNEGTSKKLLRNGDLQLRTTFIPLNKISARTIDPAVIHQAHNLVGAENCQPALSLVEYDRSLQKAMEFVFGDVLICKNLEIATKVCFHERIRKKCVTLDGDLVNPSGVFSGGSAPEGPSILASIQAIKSYETELPEKQRELEQIDENLKQYNSMKYKLEASKHELDLQKKRLLNTTFAMREEEINSLKTQIAELTTKMKSCREIEQKAAAKAKDLETKMKDATGYREKRLKEGEIQLQQAKTRAEKSKKEWCEKEQYYQVLTLEIKELRKGLEDIKKELSEAEANIEKLQQEYDTAFEESSEIKETVLQLQTEVKRVKSIIAEKNKEKQGKLKKKQQLLNQNTELELQLKKHSHGIKELTTACKTAKNREREYSKKITKNDADLKKGEAMTQKEGEELEKKIKIGQGKKYTLGRSINTQAQTMFDVVQKRFDEIVRKQNIVEHDRKKLVKTIAELDEKKEQALQLAFEQVSKDFGSIFSTLLPGAYAKLVSLQGKSILQGLQIKVSLGDVWKESLTELSGGQRSLAALSLILAMLLFKPAPLYILDEVDAALDLSHTQNIGNMLRSHFKKSQFIVVSLKDGMFNNANVLFRTKFIDGVSAVQRTENTRK